MQSYQFHGGKLDYSLGLRFVPLYQCHNNNNKNNSKRERGNKYRNLWKVLASLISNIWTFIIINVDIDSRWILNLCFHCFLSLSLSLTNSSCSPTTNHHHITRSPLSFFNCVCVCGYVISYIESNAYFFSRWLYSFRSMLCICTKIFIFRK